jgi:hypothetical protein
MQLVAQIELPEHTKTDSCQTGLEIRHSLVKRFKEPLINSQDNRSFVK